jgi:hypothetical protein
MSDKVKCYTCEETTEDYEECWYDSDDRTICTDCLEQMEMDEDPYTYYGVSRHDF